MCGIAGVIGALESPEGVGRAMAATLRHRGPDASGVSALKQASGQPVGVFAHTRLKVIDLSDAAAQPFTSADGQVVLAFNGEIYNFRELRRDLVQRGHRFRSDSDTEVLLTQYLEHGDSGLDALDGMFAFAIWDARLNILRLGRDRVGKKPLYWGRTTNGGLAFASEAKALQAVPGLRLEFDPDRLPEYLTYGYVSTPRTIYRHIGRLPPATRLHFSPGGDALLHRYWDVLDQARPRSPSVEEAKAMVRSAVGRAVGRRLVSDVPLGAFLSGGIDSSIIVAEMAARATGPVRTFSVGFDDDASYDETRYARAVADQFGTEHTELRLRPNAEAMFERLLHHHDEPYGDSSALAVHAISEATREYVTVVLTGDGGDEVFAGYDRFRGGLLLSRLPGVLARGLREVLERLPEPRGYKNPLSLARRFVEHAGRSPDEQLLAWNAYFVGPRLARLLRSDVYPRADPWAPMALQSSLLEKASDRGQDRLGQILVHNLATYLTDDLLVKTDRMTMAVGLEARSPFLDTSLIELAFGLPSRLKMRGGQLKWILREAYRDVLGPEVLDRKKHGFGVPVGRWWAGPLRGLVGEVLEGRPKLYDFLEAGEVRGLLDEHWRGLRDHGQRIFLLLQLELFLRRLVL